MRNRALIVLALVIAAMPARRANQAARERPQASDRRNAGSARRHHRRRRRRGRTHDADLGQRQARGRAGPRSHRRHRRPSARQGESDPVFAAWFTLNGNGEMTGTTWVQESGYLEGPIGITNTHSVGVVRDAIIKWEVTQKNVLQPWWLPVVAET